jgi:hypothetical protein
MVGHLVGNQVRQRTSHLEHERSVDVRFWPKADIAVVLSDVRFRR